MYYIEPHIITYRASCHTAGVVLSYRHIAFASIFTVHLILGKSCDRNDGNVCWVVNSWEKFLCTWLSCLPRHMGCDSWGKNCCMSVNSLICTIDMPPSSSTEMWSDIYFKRYHLFVPCSFKEVFLGRKYFNINIDLLSPTLTFVMVSVPKILCCSNY